MLVSRPGFVAMSPTLDFALCVPASADQNTSAALRYLHQLASLYDY